MRKYIIVLMAVCMLVVSSCAWAEKIFDFPIEDTSARITCAYQGYPGHNGYDLGAGYGTAVYALFDGTVTYKMRYKKMADGKYHSWDYGNYVELEGTVSGDSYLMRVAHLSEFDGNTYNVPSEIDGTEIIYDNSLNRLYDSNTLGMVAGSMTVKKGQLICYSGRCGNSTGNHLHIEIKQNGSFVNPDDYISNERFVGGVKINEKNFPDEIFRELVSRDYDTDHDGLLSPDETARVTRMDVSGLGITDLKGIEHFTALGYLDCSYNQLTALDVSKNTDLWYLGCYGNQITTLDLSKNTNLATVACSNNQLTELNVNNHPFLTVLSCYKNQLTELDVSNNPALTDLTCGGNQLTELNVSNNTALTSLGCGDNQLTALDVSNNTVLVYLYCDFNRLTKLDVSNNTALKDLTCGYNQLTDLNVSNNTTLTGLDCFENTLTALNVSNNTALETLSCGNNKLTTLDVSNNTALEELHCNENQLTTLDVSKNTALTVLNCDNNQLTKLDVSNNTALMRLDCYNNLLTTLDVSNCPADIYIVCDEGVKIIRNKPAFISSLVDKVTQIPVSVYGLRSSVIGSTATLIKAVSQSGIITSTPTKETLHNVARGLQIISSVYSGSFFTRFFSGSDIPQVLKASNNDETKNFQLSEILKLNVSPATLKSSQGTVKISVASSQDLSQDVYCSVMSGDNCRFFKIPNSDSSRKLFEAEFKTGELFASMDKGIVEIMCVSSISDDEGICGMLMSNTVKINWTTDNSNPPEIIAATLPNATTGKSYTAQLTASGTTPITWSRKSGSLPKGLTLSDSGTISGIPTKAGKYTFTVKATNTDGSDTQRFTLQVYEPVSIITASLKDATVTKSYSVILKGKGTKPIAWSATGLPNGLTLNAKTGKLFGKPTVYGTFSVKITASNEAGSTEKSLQLTVKAIAPKLSGSLAKATINSKYSSGLKLTAGSLPVTWSCTGTLPDGLTFDTSTGIIAGTPKSYSKSGYRLKIAAMNDAGSKYKNVTLTVKATPPKITTTKLPDATVGSSYKLALSATGSEPITWTADGLPKGLSINGSTITGKPTKSGSYKVILYATNPVKSVKKSFSLNVKASDIRLPVFALPHVDYYVVVAELGTISCDEEGMYDFDTALSDYAPVGAELLYLANSDSPSDDDEIAEFFDAGGEPITEVPDDRKITISIWLNPGTTYNPAIAITR